MEDVEKIDWDKYPIKDTFREKLVPPINPANTYNIEHLKQRVNQYLCTNCCSHKIVRTPRTASGCVDVIEIAACPWGEEDIAVPPVNKPNQLWLKLHTFVCSCKRKTLICETDKYSEVQYTKDVESYDPDQSLSELAGESLIVQNLRILQVKDLVADEETNKKVFKHNLGEEKPNKNKDKEKASVPEVVIVKTDHPTWYIQEKHELIKNEGHKIVKSAAIKEDNKNISPNVSCKS